MKPKKSPWQTKHTQLVYDNPWIAVEHSEVVNPNGGEGIYGVVRFKNVAVGVIPIDENGYTYLVGQYRYTLDQYEWEIPEGGAPHEEDPLHAAKRELLEETGLKAEHWEHLIDLQTSNSVTDERATCFVARGLSQHQAQPEETEMLRIKHLPLEHAIEMAMDGRIRDAISVAALLKVSISLRH